MNPSELELPAIHLNGDSIQTLYTEYLDAYRALKQARSSFRASTCHPRNFYVKGDDSYIRAHSQRQTALFHVEQALSYLETHVQYLSQQSNL